MLPLPRSVGAFHIANPRPLVRRCYGVRILGERELKVGVRRQNG